MRRQEIFDALDEVVSTLEESLLPKVFDEILTSPLREQMSESMAATILDSLRRYAVRAQGFSSAAKTLAKIMGISELEDAKYWSKLLPFATAATSASTARTYYVMNRNIDFVLTYLPRIKALLEPEVLQEKNISRYKGQKVLSVIVLEEPNQFSTPSRLTQG